MTTTRSSFVESFYTAPSSFNSTDELHSIINLNGKSYHLKVYHKKPDSDWEEITQNYLKRPIKIDFQQMLQKQIKVPCGKIEITTSILPDAHSTCKIQCTDGTIRKIPFSLTKSQSTEIFKILEKIKGLKSILDSSSSSLSKESLETLNSSFIKMSLEEIKTKRIHDYLKKTNRPEECNQNSIESPNTLQKKIQDKTVVKGLENVGNTCYMNSALQPLLAIRNFEQIIPDSVASEPKDSLEARRKILASFKDFFKVWKNKETAANLGHKIGALRREIFEAGLLEGGFIDREQERAFQDAGQFFELILHVLGKGFQLEITRTPVKDDGESMEARERKEVTSEGVFYLKSPGDSLQEIVNGYRVALGQKFTPGNEWRVEVEDPNSQSKISEILISRYKEMQKIIGSAPEILVVRIDDHVVKPEQDQMIDFTALFKEPIGNCNYELVGFSQNHYQVHWTSVVQKENNWYYCNDSRIQPVLTEDPCFKHPANYMIFQKQAN